MPGRACSGSVGQSHVGSRKRGVSDSSSDDERAQKRAADTFTEFWEGMAECTTHSNETEQLPVKTGKFRLNALPICLELCAL